MKWTTLSVTLLLALSSAANALAFVAGHSKSGEPGSYVTLSYEFEGDGRYQFEVDAPEGWTPITKTRTVDVRGKTFVPFTFVVPRGASAGQDVPVVLKASQNGVEVARGTASVAVTRQVRIEMRAPEAVSARTNGPGSYTLTVTNFGNARDRVDLGFSTPERAAVVTPSSLELGPGETATATVTVRFELPPTSGYEYITFLEARSAADPSLVVRSRTTLKFTDPRQAAAKNDDPSVRIVVGTSARADVEASGGNVTTNLSYSVQPQVTAVLSDFVKGSAPIGGLTGDTERPVSLPSSVGLQLSGRGWNASASTDGRGVGLGGSVEVGPWTVEANGSLRDLGSTPRYGLGVTGSTRIDPDDAAQGDVRLNAQLSGSGGDHTESFGVRYRRPLSSTLNLELQPFVIGSSLGGRYRVDLGTTQQLSWTEQGFDLIQTYAGTLGGSQIVSLSGGMRTLSPVGVRGSSSVVLAPDGLIWRGAAVVLASPARGLSLGLQGVLQTSTVVGVLPFWSVSPTASFGVRLGSAQLGLGANYTHLQRLAGDPRPDQTASVSADVTVDRFRIGGRANWSDTLGSDTERDTEWDAVLTARYVLGFTDALSLEYSYNAQDQKTTHGLAGTWERAWTPDLSTGLSYRREWLTAGSTSSTPETLGLSVQLGNLLPDTSVSLGYGVTAPNGLLGGGPLSQRLSLGVGYNLSFDVRLPTGVVDAFGGRIGGEVRGVLFRDANLNGLRDADELPLEGIVVRAGDVSATTDARGEYRLRLPRGRYVLEFLGNLPATLDTLAPVEVTVTENGSVIQDVGFASVGSVDLQVFDDLNRDGTSDADEAPMPYTSFVLSGPISRRVTTDSRGGALVSGLPFGRYDVTFEASGLPEGYRAPDRAVSVDLAPGARLPTVKLGVSVPPRQQVSTYTGSAIGLFARFTEGAATAGGAAPLDLRLTTAVDSLRVVAFGRELLVPGSELARVARVDVPAGTAPGLYDVVVTAQAGTRTRTVTVRLDVR